MEASQNLTNFITREKLTRIGFDPILAESVAEEIKLGPPAPIQQTHANRYLPRPPKSIPLPPDVIDPRPQQARMRTGSFMHRGSGEL